MTEDLIIRIKQEIDSKGLKGLEADLKQVRSAMNQLVESGKRNTVEYRNLSQAAGQLVAKQKELRNEQKGLNAQMGMSSSAMLNFGKNISAIGIGLGLAIGLARQFAQQLWQVAKAGAEFQVLKNHFEKVSGSVEQAANDMQLLKTAVSGNLNEAEIITFTNRMRDMGLTTHQSAQILDLAERHTDVYGGTIDEATTKLFSFIETGKGRGFEQLGIDVAKVNQKTEELVKGLGKTTATMDSEELSAVRLQVAMELYGSSVDDIIKKLPELDDKLISSEKKFDNLKLSIGILLAEGLEPTITALGTLASVFDGTAISMKPVDDTLKNISSGLITTKDVINILLSPVSTLISLLGKLWSMMDRVSSSAGNIARNLSNAAPSGFFRSIFSMLSDVILKVREAVGWLNKLPGINIDSSQVANGGTSTYKDAMDATPSSSDSGSKGSSNNTVAKESTISGIISEQISKQNELLKNLQLKGELLTDFYELSLKELDAYNLGTLSLEEQNKILEQRNKLKSLHWTGLKTSMTGISGDDIPDRNFMPYEKRKEITSEEMLSGAVDSTQRIRDIFTNMASTLGMEADSFVGKLVSGFDSVLGTLQTIMSIIEAQKTISSFLSFLIPGAATGGMIAGAGSGTSDSILARLSNGEFVVNAAATSQYLPLLQAINGSNGSLANMIGRYASGGYVSGGNNNIALEVADVKLSGSDLYLSWRRQNRKETGRLG